MPQFEKDHRVSHKSDARRRGRIDNVQPAQGGHQFYEVLFDDGALQMCEESELIQEVIIKTAWDLMATNSLHDYRGFSISSTVHKVRNTTSNTISTLKASRTIFKPYQYKPLVKFLKSDIKRLLIADEVGLGKTIEAGHIMLELAARGQLQNGLIICPNSLKDKWKTELREKFNFHFKIYESSREFIRDLEDESGSKKRSIFGILNYEKCRNDAIKDCLENIDYSFDIIICDEAHKIRNSETAQHKGVNAIIASCEAAVFLTATPIMTDIRNLHSLIRVLDPEGYDTYDIFNNAVRLNKPFIVALSQLNSHVPLKEISEQLSSAIVLQELSAKDELFESTENTVNDIFKEDELYQRVQKKLLNEIDTPTTRAEAQQDLVDLNSLNHLYTRTRKKDVQNELDVVQRSAKTLRVELSQEERDFYDGIIEQYDDQHPLGLLQRKRQVSSSIIGYQIDEDQDLTSMLEEGVKDSKYFVFRSIVKTVTEDSGRKLIVFAFFIKTLKYLKARLEREGISCEIIHGGVSDRTEHIEHFRDNPKIKILLSSEVGSEGLDLQFCDALVNYDLPWNPMVIEQRIGRIDRVGQKSPVINIYNLILENTIEARIHDRLYERIKLFQESLGDLEEILGESEALGDLMTKQIEGLYKKHLSKEEQNERLDQLRQAFENEKLTLKRVESELSDAFANDVHFQNEITRIQNNRRYLTKSEIIQFIESGIRRSLNYIQLNHKDESLAELRIPKTSNKDFFDFVEKYKDHPKNSPEIDVLYRQFKTKYYGSDKIELTFDQEYAYQYKSVEYISAFHPLVNALTNYFTAENLHQNQAHKVAISLDDIKDVVDVTTGYYVLTTYKISVTRNFGDDRISNTEILKASLADLNGDQVQIFSSDLADSFMGQLQLHGKRFTTDIPLDSEFVRTLRGPIMTEMKQTELALRDDHSIKFNSSLKRRFEQEIRYIDSWLDRREKQLADGKGIENIIRFEIEKLNTRKENLKAQFKKASLSVTHSMISANLIEVL
jgi:superfamily II DNA/RNA helicase